MRTKSYSNDLRERVIKNIESGSTYQEACSIYKISLSTVGRWYKRYKDEGEYKVKNRGGSKRRINLEELKNYVIFNPDMQLR